MVKLQIKSGFIHLFILPGHVTLAYFYFVGAEGEERSGSGGGEGDKRGRTCKWHSEFEARTSLMVFCLNTPRHAGAAAAASPSCSAALITGLCLGCEMAQMLAEELLHVLASVDCGFSEL